MIYTNEGGRERAVPSECRAITLARRRTRAVPKTKVYVSGKGEFLNSGRAQLQAQRLGRGTPGGQAPQVDR